MDTEITTVVERLKARCRAENIKPSTFGQKHFSNSRLLARLEGGSLSLRNYEKLLKILDEPIAAETKTEAA